MTSTYDHRVIQGAESGEFLARVDGLLQGGERFYDEVRASLGMRLPALRMRGQAEAATARTARARRAFAPIAARSGDLCSRRRGDGPGDRRTGPMATSPRTSTRWAPSRSATRRSIRCPLGLTPEVMADACPTRCCAEGRRARPSPRPARAAGRPTAARSPTSSSTSPIMASGSGCAADDRDGRDTAARPARGPAAGCWAA